MLQEVATEDRGDRDILLRLPAERIGQGGEIIGNAKSLDSMAFSVLLDEYNIAFDELDFCGFALAVHSDEIRLAGRLHGFESFNHERRIKH